MDELIQEIYGSTIGEHAVWRTKVMKKMLKKVKR